MYFASRVQAGRMLAAKLVDKYRYENCAVVALGDGGVVVGAQIAAQLHCVLMMLQSEEITLPRETTAIGGMTEGGSFSFNHAFSQGEIDEAVSEYHEYIEQEKLAHFHHMNTLVGSGGSMSPDLLRGHTVILVSDGLRSPFPLDMAMGFLKPIAIDRLVMATPIASVQAIDRMHILADEICCLDVVAECMEIPHYYEAQDIPEHAKIISTLEQIILQWK